jgi:hypothetical protein
MKTCYICKAEKELPEFVTYKESKTQKIKIMSRCRSCDRKRPRPNKINRNHKTTLFQWFEDYKRTLSCVDCGMSFRNAPYCCDFHHRDPSTKTMTIASALSHIRSKRLVLEELPKCDPLCANCHRKRHYHEGAKLRLRKERTQLSIW